MGDNFHIGVCSDCHQKNELHVGTDNRLHCENCLVSLGLDPETANRLQRQPPKIDKIQKPETEGRIQITPQPSLQRFQRRKRN